MNPRSIDCEADALTTTVITPASLHRFIIIPGLNTSVLLRVVILIVTKQLVLGTKLLYQIYFLYSAFSVAKLQSYNVIKTD